MSISSKANKVIELCAEKDVFYLESTLRFPKESIDEVKQIHEEGYFVRHRGGDSKGWLSCALHGWGAGPRPEYYRTMNPSGYGFTEEQVVYGWTELEEIAPRSKEFLLDHFDCSVMRRARFMLLEPGGYITAHKDGEKRAVNSAINVCLTQPKDCYLRRADTLEEVPFEPTKMFFYDNRVLHEAQNNSNEKEHMTVNYNHLTSVLIKAVQELSEQVRELKTKVNANTSN